MTGRYDADGVWIPMCVQRAAEVVYDDIVFPALKEWILSGNLDLDAVIDALGRYIVDNPTPDDGAP